MLVDLSLRDLAEQTAARTPTPGGGSISACMAALGTALGAMAARFTQGRKGFEAHEPALAREIGRLDALRAQCLDLVDADAAAYDTVTAAYGLPKADDNQKASRQAAIQAALQGALQTPLAACRLAVDALVVLDDLSAHVNPNLASDVAVGAYALGAGFRGAWVNVLINLGGLKDDALRRRVLSEGDSLGARAHELAERIETRIVAPLRA